MRSGGLAGGLARALQRAAAMDRAAAIVVGDLSLIRALGKKGIPVVLATSEPRSSSTLSRYCVEVIPTPSVVDRPGAVVDAVIAWAGAQRVKPVIFCQGDDDLLAFSRERDRVRRVAHLPLPPADLVEDLVDKVRFAALAQRLALPVPATITLLHGTSLGAQLAAWRHFPCVLKPSMRAGWIGSALQVDGIGSTQKAMRIETAAELQRVAPLFAPHATNLILQAAIEGGEDRIVSYHAYLRPRSTSSSSSSPSSSSSLSSSSAPDDIDVVAEFTGRKVRTSPRRYGFSTCVEITDERDVKAIGRDICRTLDFSGVLKMDFKRHHDGSLHLLEINPRFNLWHHPATLAGACIPALVYADCTAPGSAQTPVTVKSGVRWMSGQDDVRSMREHRATGDLSLTAWLRQVVTVDVNESFTLSDPLPGLRELSRIASRKVLRRFAPRAVA